MNARWKISLAAGTVMLLFGTSLAPAAEPTFVHDRSAVQGSAGIVACSTLMGGTVLSLQGEKLGSINDIMLDPRTGQATLALVDAKIPGPDHAMLAVPFQALWVSSNPLDHRQSVTLNLRPDQVRAAPQIQSGQRQMLENPQFLEQARNFYQIKTYTVARPIDNSSMPAPSLPSTAMATPSIPPCVVPPPCSTSVDSGWTRDLEDFYNE
jgi:hypothetical protein